MPLPSYIGAYEDIRSVLDAAIAANGALFTPRNSHNQPDPKAVTYWIARANRFRSLLRRSGDSGPYEPLRFAKDGVRIRILVQPAPQAGDLTTLDGDQLSPSAVVDTLTEEERAIIDALREQL